MRAAPCVHSINDVKAQTSLLHTLRTRRGLTWALLLAMVFALNAAWANACLLEARGTHAHVAEGHNEHGAQAIAVWAGHAGAAASHGEASSPAKAPCLKACDDTSQALVKQKAGPEAGDTDLALHVPYAWVISSAFGYQPSEPAYRQEPRAGQPLRLRFSRLTL